MAFELVKEATYKSILCFQYAVSWKNRKNSPTFIVITALISTIVSGCLINGNFYSGENKAIINLNKKELYNNDPKYIAHIILSQIPNTEIRYYDISGTTPSAIREAMNERRPMDPNDWGRYDALTTWHIDWRWPSNGMGGCDLSRLTLSFRATVLMPNLVDIETVDERTQRRWKKYILSLAKHELGHIKHAYEHRLDVYEAVRRSSCESANGAGEAALQRLKDFDIEYDAATAHGATQGAVWP